VIAVIQCAAKKRTDAGHLRTADGRNVLFVAAPAGAPPSSAVCYARPDDRSDAGGTWRERLLDYNRGPGANSLGLCRAIDLYANSAYHQITERYGADRTFILSAGWGLIRGDFLTPNYDITLSTAAEPYQRRKRADHYRDFAMTPDNSDDPVVFFGGKDYVPLFEELTRSVKTRRTVFYNSDVPPVALGCSVVRFRTTTRTNWHYECAQAFLRGAIEAA
jgi:hypothetical protein